MEKSAFVYIMTNENQTTLYIGVTNDLCRRIHGYKSHLNSGSFTDRYNFEYCIYYEEFPRFEMAIKREKEINKWNRQKKIDLINKKNPAWNILVTEKGFIRSKKSFADEVNKIINEMRKDGKIPPLSQ